MEKIITRRANGSMRVLTQNTKPSRTNQSFKEQSDVNNIMRQYQKTGELPLSKKIGQYLDGTTVPEYQQAIQTVMDANSAFEQLPAKLRDRFNNDPAKLLAFVQDPSNRDEAVFLGILSKNEPSQTTTPQKMRTNESNEQTQNKKGDEKTASSNPSPTGPSSGSGE